MASQQHLHFLEKKKNWLSACVVKLERSFSREQVKYSQMRGWGAGAETVSIVRPFLASLHSVLSLCEASLLSSRHPSALCNHAASRRGIISLSLLRVCATVPCLVFIFSLKALFLSTATPVKSDELSKQTRLIHQRRI